MLWIVVWNSCSVDCGLVMEEKRREREGKKTNIRVPGEE